MNFSDIVQNAAGISAIVASLSFLVGAVTLIKTRAEYIQQNSMKRFEKFQEMRKRFKEDDTLTEICFLLEEDSDKLRDDVHFKQKLDFLGFFEEVALMHNSGLLRTSIAHYMFGYYAIRCYQSEKFWSNVNRGSHYWALFGSFARKMEEREKTFDGVAIKQLERFKF
jgi:hypothetical protein